jgi:hypothetical protein
MKHNSVISHRYDETKKACFLTWDKEPYVKAKIVKLFNQQEADNFHNNEKTYASVPVQGYNVFIIFAGYTENSGYEVPGNEILNMIQIMARWYLSNIIPTLSSPKRKKLSLQIH